MARRKYGSHDQAVGNVLLVLELAKHGAPREATFPYSEALSLRSVRLAAAVSRPVRLHTWWPQPTALLDSRLDSANHG